jgi:hypothetical protein
MRDGEQALHLSCEGCSQRLLAGGGEVGVIGLEFEFIGLDQSRIRK